eukprot:1461545-Pleurochrysis_carterae.AAC.1
MQARVSPSKSRCALPHTDESSSTLDGAAARNLGQRVTANYISPLSHTAQSGIRRMGERGKASHAQETVKTKLHYKRCCVRFPQTYTARHYMMRTTAHIGEISDRRANDFVYSQDMRFGVWCASTSNLAGASERKHPGPIIALACTGDVEH